MLTKHQKYELTLSTSKLTQLRENLKRKGEIELFPNICDVLISGNKDLESDPSQHAYFDTWTTGTNKMYSIMRGEVLSN